MEEKRSLNLAFLPTIWSVLGFIMMLIGNYWLFFGRKKDFLRIGILEENLPGFYLHISNFSILFALLVIIGFIWLLLGVAFYRVFLMGISLIAINFIYELWIPVINVPDIIDAYYGLAGGILGLSFLFVVHKAGLRKNTTQLFPANQTSNR